VRNRRTLSTLAILGMLSCCCTPAASGQHAVRRPAPRAMVAASSLAASSGRPRVCSSGSLVQAIRIIDNACNEISCDFASLRQLNTTIEKGALLAAFQNPDLHSVHIFFPINRTRLNEAFDWQTTKRDQLATLKYIPDPGQSVVYVLGRASAVGDRDRNVALSRERMRNVLEFLKRELGVQCHAFHGGWFGDEIQQLTPSDAHLLNIEPLDYRNDRLILNQSVHIFVFPCADLL
jgi:hypothetical protein